MAIRTESTGTPELLLDGRYHLAALLSDPEAEALAPAAKAVLLNLRRAHQDADEKEGDRVEAQALYDRADILFDARVRQVDLEALAAVGGRRDDERYRQIFPRRASAIIALRGAEEQLAVEAMLKSLAAALPELAKRHAAELRRLGQAATDAESALLKAEATSAAAHVAELAARRALVRQLRKNEGALLAQYPGQRSTVRGYFRRRRHAPDNADSGSPETPPGGDTASSQ